MLSTTKTTDELGRLEEMLRGVTTVYGHAIRSTAQYALEIDPRDVHSFRGHLVTLQGEARSARTLEEWHLVQASFRGELRDYRDRGLARLAQLRSEVEAAANAMQSFADGVTTNGVNHEAELKEALRKLEAAAQCNSLAEIQAEITSVCSSITTTVEKMERSHQLVVMQLGDEIRLLHKQIEIERQALFLDRATGVWNRQKLDSRVAELCEQNDTFCILLVSIRNLKTLDSQFSKTVIEGAVKALLQRLTNLLGEEVKIGRWSEESFAAVLEMEPSAATGISREAAVQLWGTYAVHENGLSQIVHLEVITGVADRTAGADGPSFHQRLVQMSEALSEA